MEEKEKESGNVALSPRLEELLGEDHRLRAPSGVETRARKGDVK